VHTGLSPRTVPGTNGEVSAPKGTHVQIKTRADREVARASLSVNGQMLPLKVSGGRDLTGGFTVDKSGSYQFVFRSSSDKVLVEGPSLPIQAEADEPPQVRILSPAEELEVDPGTQLTLRFDVSDDYGLAGLALVYRPPGQEEQRIPLRHDEGRRSSGQYTWNLGTLKLQPGDRVSYFIEAKDNDAVEGSKKGVSRTQIVKLYSAAEHRRAAVEKAQALWERLVTHLADRLEGPDRAKEKDFDKVAAAQSVDRAAQDLIGDFREVAGELSKDRDSPQELVSALVNISQGLNRHVRSTSDARRTFVRYQKLHGLDFDSGKRLTRDVEAEIRETEKDVLYLEALLDKQKLQDLRELAQQLSRERRELASLIEQYKQTQDPKLQQQILEQVKALRERIDELMQRMSELASGIRDEHLNAEALKQMMEEKDLSSGLDQIEKLMREGKAEEALAELQKLAMQMEQMVSELSEADDGFGEQQYPELAEKFQQFMNDLQKTAQDQKAVADKTKEIRDRYKQKLKERLQSKGDALREQMIRDIDQVLKDYQFSPDAIGSMAEKPHEEVRSELESLRQALKVRDYDLAAESAARAERAAHELNAFAQSQREQDERYRNPADMQAQSRKLAERTSKNAMKVSEVNEKLQQLFPPPGSMISEEDKQKLKQLSGEQRGLEKQAQGLQQKLDELAQMAPLFDEQSKEQMAQVQERMGGAAQRMETRDPSRGYSEQKAALDQLQQFEKDMRESKGKGGGRGLPLPMYGGGRQNDWGGHSNNRDKVEIPDADRYQAPKEFRKDLLDAMKQGAPERYKEQVKRYYEELVK
jgi:hypothetical protein